jgi:hypothetical protein
LIETGAGVKFPALSVQPPLAEAAAWSGPAYVTAEQAAMPEVASLPCQMTATGWLNQPLKSAPRAKLAVTLVGGSASILMFFVLASVPSPFVAVHVNVLPGVGPGIRIAGSQPTVLVNGGSAVTVQ